MDREGKPRLSSVAPFGRIGRILGFRWVFFWTMAIPFHPLLAWALLLAPPALILHRAYEVTAGKSGGVTAFGLLLAAALIAVPMSIPVVNWFGQAFRLPLVQALLIGGAMLLIAFEVAAGHAPPWQALFPAAFLLLFLVQRFGGPAYLRRLEAANEAFERIDPGQRQVAFEEDTVAGGHAKWLFDKFDVAKSAAIGGSRRRPTEDRRYFRLSASDFEQVGALVGTRAPAGWSVSKDPANPYLVAPGADLEPDAIRIRSARHRAPLWLITGRRTSLEIAANGGTRRLVGGEAALVGNLPLFVIFHFTSITHPNLSQWVIGFVRWRPKQLGTGRVYDLLANAFPPRPDHGGSVVEDAGSLLAELRAAIGEAQAGAIGALDKLIGSIGKEDREYVPVRTLMENPQYIFGQGRRLIDGIRRAAPTNDSQAVRTLAQLLAKLPAEEFQGLSNDIIELLNSKRLAYRVLGGSDPSIVNAPEAERQKHALSSYSLIIYAPDLYMRLGELGEPARPLIMGLGELGGWPVPLARARDELDRRRSS